jgi:hypothetical protein
VFATNLKGDRLTGFFFFPKIPKARNMAIALPHDARQGTKQSQDQAEEVQSPLL